MVCESAPVRDLIATSKGFLKMSLQQDLWCKMQFFGEDIERANQEGERIGTRGPRNLLELLPDEFTIEDAKRVRKQQGMNESRTKKMIAIWMYVMLQYGMGMNIQVMGIVQQLHL